MNIIYSSHRRRITLSSFVQVARHLAGWLTVLRAVFGLPIPEDDLPLFKQLTGREAPPEQQVQECWLVVGRRGGKSFVVSLMAVYLACFKDYRPSLGPGERGVLMIIATDRKQARVIMRYLTALLQSARC